MLITKSFYEACSLEIYQSKIVWVAYSGGVDSHVLLHLAHATFPAVRAIHINHGLSPNANAWQQHCMQVCDDLNITLDCHTVDARPNAKQSPEDAARNARRKVWRTVLGAADLLLTAHHAADQAETILYRLFRGAGTAGLVGMQQCTKIGATTMLRPLLNISKQEILDYATRHDLKYITDESNINTKYDRNFIRQNIMPLLSSRWPAVEANINRAGSLGAQLLTCLQPYVAENLYAVVDHDTLHLNIDKLLAFATHWQNEILRAWLQLHEVTPSLQQIELLLQEVVHANGNADPLYKVAHKVVKRCKRMLYIVDYKPVLNVVKN